MTDPVDATNLAERIDRLESRAEIRQLAFRYALAVDMRDIDAIVNLYVEDVRATRDSQGRQALKTVFAKVLRNFTTSVHFVGNQIVEFDGPDLARGVTYCRCEHEVGDVWVPMYLYYLDTYARRNGRWYFRRRIVSRLFAAPLDEAPVGPNKVRWPGQPPTEGTWHAHFPSWDAFWTDPEADGTPVRSEAPAGGFVDDMRRGDRSVIYADFSWAEQKG